jgi:hypothetical protein
MEGKNMEAYKFDKERFQMHDPLKIVENHHSRVSVYFTYSHEESLAKEAKKRALTYEEVKNNPINCRT